MNETVTIRHSWIWPWNYTRAIRVAELLRYELGVKAALEKGSFGEFSILVNGVVVIQKNLLFLPSDKQIVRAVRKRVRGGLSKYQDKADGALFLLLGDCDDEFGEYLFAVGGGDPLGFDSGSVRFYMRLLQP